MFLFSTCRRRPMLRGAAALAKISYHLAGRRREIALKNLQLIYGATKSQTEIAAIARASFVSFLSGLVDIPRFRGLVADPRALSKAKKLVAGSDQVLEQARRIHIETGGCIFVSPHIGNFSALPGLFAAAGVPLVIPVHELDNPWIHRRWWPLNMEAQPGSEIFVPRRNSLSALRRALDAGRSVGIMPDQRTQRGLSINFLDHAALTTPIPALLSVAYQRPILICVCLLDGADGYRMQISEPLWPQISPDKKGEIRRLTHELNRMMGAYIRAHPEQYFWVHDRWKAPTRGTGKPQSR